MNNSAQSESIAELGKALVKAQAMMAPAVKDARNPFLGTRYASLSSVMEACREALLKNGLAVVQSPAPAPEHLGPNFIGLSTRLIHAESGQWISGLTVIPLAKPDPQGMGAAISYARRYALSAMLGIVSEDDNDCETRTPQRNGQSARPEPQRNGQAARPERGAPPDAWPPDDEIRGEPARRNGAQRGDPPILPGVEYSTETREDGREYIVATGNTKENREALKRHGFSWNSARQLWYRAA